MLIYSFNAFEGLETIFDFLNRLMSFIFFGKGGSSHEVLYVGSIGRVISNML